MSRIRFPWVGAIVLYRKGVGIDGVYLVPAVVYRISETTPVVVDLTTLEPGCHNCHGIAYSENAIRYTWGWPTPTPEV